MNLFLCKTPMQLLRAMQLTYSEEAFANSAVAVFQTFNNAQAYGARLKETGLFAAVSVFKDGDFAHGRLNHARAFLAKNDFRRFLDEHAFTELTTFNSDTYDNFVAWNRLGRKVKIRYVEDSPMLYCYPTPSRKHRLFYGLFGLSFPIFHVDEWYFSIPEKMPRTNRAPAYALKPLDRQDKEFVALVNQVFAYAPDPKVSEADVFIMEECFYTDGLLVDNADYRLYKRIKERFPKVAFTVKLHPRTKVNRFAQTFTCAEETTIPWEVFLLNEDFDDRIFMSLSCTSMISPKLLFGKEFRSMMLYKICGDSVKLKNGEPYYTVQWQKQLEEVAGLYSQSDRICVPRTEEEMFIQLDRWTAACGEQERG